MTAADWATESAEAMADDGPVAGLAEAAREFYWGARARCRRLHWLAPNHRTHTIGGRTLTFRQQSIAEFDHMRPMHNETPLIEHFVREIGPGDIVWDVGANVGSWTLPATDAGADVYAFEPIPSNQAALRYNLNVNDLDATVVGLALSDTSGQASMTYDSRHTAGAGQNSLYASEASGEQISVLTATGESLPIPAPDVVKVDVEGAELAVLSGLGDRLDGARRVFVELHGRDDHSVRRLLDSAGFDVEQTPSATECGILEVAA